LTYLLYCVKVFLVSPGNDSVFVGQTWAGNNEAMFLYAPKKEGKGISAFLLQKCSLSIPHLKK